MITLIPFNLKVNSIHAKMRDLMLHIVGTGVLDCPQPFCRFATFPLTGEQPRRPAKRDRAPNPVGDTLTLESYAFVVESAQANKVSRGGLLLPS